MNNDTATSTRSSHFIECHPTLQAWVQASRPAFYIATLTPLLLGFIRAGQDTGHWQPGLFSAVLLCCFFLHMSANLANDVFDHLQGVDAGPNIGGSRALQEGKITLAQYATALLLLNVGALVLAWVGVEYTGRGGIWAIVVFGLLSSFFYVAPPIKYGHRALGEVLVFTNMGLVMTAGTYYTLTGSVTARVIALAIPVGLMVAGILYYQSLPEIETDKAVGKHTLANVLGKKRAVALFRLWWPSAWAILLVLVVCGYASWVALVGIIAGIPLYRKACVHLRHVDDWLSLDAHGHLIRKMYLVAGLALILSQFV